MLNATVAHIFAIIICKDQRAYLRECLRKHFMYERIKREATTTTTTEIHLYDKTRSTNIKPIGEFDYNSLYYYLSVQQKKCSSTFNSH